MMIEQQRAVLAGGCFWGMQDLIRSRPGVLATRVGYTGGDTPNATYRNHGSHAEAIEITYDPAATTYRDLLEFFFQIHDPSTTNRQSRRPRPWTTCSASRTTWSTRSWGPILPAHTTTNPGSSPAGDRTVAGRLFEGCQLVGPACFGRRAMRPPRGVRSSLSG